MICPHWHAYQPLPSSIQDTQTENETNTPPQKCGFFNGFISISLLCIIAFVLLNFSGLQEKYEQLTAHVDDLKQHLKDANRSSKAYELRIANMEEDIVESAEILGERKKEIASKEEEIQILQRRIGELEAKIESYLEDLEDKRAEIEQSSAMKQVHFNGVLNCFGTEDVCVGCQRDASLCKIDNATLNYGDFVYEGFNRAQRFRRCLSIYDTLKNPHESRIYAFTDPKKFQNQATGVRPFGYIDVQKAGSSSIIHILEQVAWNYDRTLGARYDRKCEGALIDSTCRPFRFWRDLFLWSVVRNPVTKFESGVRQAWFQDESLRDYTADEVLEGYLEGRLMNEHLRPNMVYLTGRTEKMNVGHLIDFIGKVEEIDRLDVVLNILGESRHIPKSRINQRKNSITRQDWKLSDESIRKMCASELFGLEWFCLGYELPEVCNDTYWWSNFTTTFDENTSWWGSY